MRDTFRRELAKSKSFQSGAAGGCTKKSKWTYFELMLFINDTFIAKPPTSNIAREEENEDIISESDNEESVGEGQSNKGKTIDEGERGDVFRTPATEKIITEHRNKLQKKRKGSANVYERLVDIEQKKLETFNSKAKLADDSDYHFLMSLMPLMKALPPERNMQMRVNIQQLFVTDLYQNTPRNTSSTSQPSPCDTYSSESIEEQVYSPTTIDRYTVPLTSSDISQQPSSFNERSEDAAGYFHTFK